QQCQHRDQDARAWAGGLEGHAGVRWRPAWGTLARDVNISLTPSLAARGGLRSPMAGGGFRPAAQQDQDLLAGEAHRGAGEHARSDPVRGPGLAQLGQHTGGEELGAEDLRKRTVEALVLSLSDQRLGGTVHPPDARTRGAPRPGPGDLDWRTRSHDQRRAALVPEGGVLDREPPGFAAQALDAE